MFLRVLKFSKDAIIKLPFPQVGSTIISGEISFEAKRKVTLFAKSSLV